MPSRYTSRGADKPSIRANLSGSQHRFYTLRIKAGQHLKIGAEPDDKTRSELVPSVFVMPPCGKYNGDKTATYAGDSSRQGN